MQNNSLPITVWVQFESAKLLSKMAENQRGEEADFVADLVRGGMRKRDARVRAAAVRAERWPSISAVVGRALEERLAEEDLAGPWKGLTPAELARLSLSGAWPGPTTGQRLVQRRYSLPSAMVLRLRTISWRLSEGPLTALEERGLIGQRVLSLSDEEHAERLRLAAQLYPVGRIVREALARYGPVPAGPQ
ncbi:hypothetical protein [Kitasatospora sp. NPDC057541]|uniref:hypothetical protein n=1 Tax=unclassified Kitasatospora TaxID=2633591 RepID=UPI003674B28A